MTVIDLHDENLEQAILQLPYSDNISKENGILIPESDYGFAEIYRMYNDVFVFLIPMYGGTPIFYKSYGINTTKSLIEDLKKIT